MNMGGGDSMYDSVEYAYKCDWQPVPERQGNWIGHVFPGLIFIIWGTHWLISMYMRYFESRRAGQHFRSQTSEYILPFIKPCLRASQRFPIEAFLKTIGGFLLFWLQVTYGGYKELYCPADTPKAGHIATQHLNSWAHATMNLGFMVSGIVELLGTMYEMPEGTTQGFLSLAFFVEYLLMGLHEKHGSLDSLLHKLLAYSMLGGSFFAGLECVFPTSMAVSAGRAVAMIVQGTWFWQSGSVLFGGYRFWEDKFMGPDHKMITEMGPAMFLPVAFSLHVLFVSLFAVLLFVVMSAIYVGRRQVPVSTYRDGYTYEAAGLLSGHESGMLRAQQAELLEAEKLVALQPMPLSTRM